MLESNRWERIRATRVVAAVVFAIAAAGCTAGGSHWSTARVLAAMDRGGIRCHEVLGPRAFTSRLDGDVVRLSVAHCTLNPSLEPIRIETFDSSGAAEAYRAVDENILGGSEVLGDAWTVKTERPSTARRFHDVLGGKLSIPCHTPPECTRPYVTVPDVTGRRASQAADILSAGRFEVMMRLGRALYSLREVRRPTLRRTVVDQRVAGLGRLPGRAFEGSRVVLWLAPSR
jgi:hypothetical protein